MSDFNWLLRKAGFVTDKLQIDRKQAMDFLDVSERTLERWMGGSKPCARAVKLLKIRCEGKIPHNRWEGFFIDKEGMLFTPQGHSYDPDFINKIYIMQKAAGFQDSQLAQMDIKLKNLAHVEQMRNEIARLGKEIHDIISKQEYSDRPYAPRLRIV